MRSPEDELLHISVADIDALHERIAILRGMLEDQRSLAALWMARYASCRRNLQLLAWYTAAVMITLAVVTVWR